MQCGLGTKFCELVIEYIDMFYEEHQVVDDLRPFFKLLKKEDTNMFRDHFREKQRVIEIQLDERPTIMKKDGHPATGSHLNED